MMNLSQIIVLCIEQFLILLTIASEVMLLLVFLLHLPDKLKIVYGRIMLVSSMAAILFGVVVFIVCIDLKIFKKQRILKPND